MSDNNDQQPKPFNEAELNDFVRDLNLSKASALNLGSRLKAKRMLSTHTTFAWYKHRDNEYIRFFCQRTLFSLLCGCTRPDKEIGNRL